MTTVPFYLDWTFWNCIVTLVVGGVAFVVYKLSKISEKKNAATIIVMDIRHAELVVLSILEKGFVDKSLKPILHENNWNKYKHLFASNFSSDDFGAFNRFFSSCEEISDARDRLNDIFYSSLNEKAIIMQQKLLRLTNIDTPEGQKKRDKIINKVNNETYTFDPNEPKEKVFKSLQLMGRLSNTVAFEKMKKIACIKS